MNFKALAASAELLRERVANGHTGCVDNTEAHRPETIDEAVITDLRAQLDTDIDGLEPYFSFETWPEAEKLPEWITRFERIRDVLDDVDEIPTVPGAVEEVPFVEVWWPLVESEHEAVFEKPDADRLSETARRGFERLLLDRLTDYSASALHVDFHSYIEENGGEAAPESQSTDSREWYEAYLTAFFDGRMDSFFQEFSMVARKSASIVRNWRTFFDSFVSRLADDAPSLHRELDIEAHDIVQRVTPAGDPHNRGKHVLIVAFDSGVEIVYKPRTVEPEARLYEFQSWLGEMFADVPEYETPALVDRSNYGWVEKVDYGDHRSIDAVKNYYDSAGGLLCISYALSMSDCHLENVIATPNVPTLIDAETVFELGTVPARTTELTADGRFRRLVVDSTVLGTQFLPFGRGTDKNSGFGDHRGQHKSVPKPIWKDVNTDAMDVEYVKPARAGPENLPTHDGVIAVSHEYVADVVAGFETVYDAIRDAKPTVKRKLEALFAGVRSRFIFRNTKAYYELLRTLQTPRYLRSGAMFGYKIHDSLSMRSASRTFASDTKLKHLAVDLWDEVIDCEYQSICRGDVPRFEVVADDHALYHDGRRVVSDFTERTGIQRAHDQIDQFSHENKRFQSGLVRACLQSDRPWIQSHPGGYT